MTEIRNKFGERIDALVEGKEDADATIVFVHGSGTDKNEGENLFVDISKTLGKKFRIVRFDFSGFFKPKPMNLNIFLNKFNCIHSNFN